MLNVLEGLAVGAINHSIIIICDFIVNVSLWLDFFFLAYRLSRRAALMASGIPLKTGEMFCLLLDLISQTECRALNK